jgi:anti-sigma factor RsiW
LLTCKQFLQELTDYLDEALDPTVRKELERHVSECPNCWVVCNTTKKTLQVFKGMEAKAVPSDIQGRLMAALEKRIAARGPICGGSSKGSAGTESASDAESPDRSVPRPLV